MAWLLLGERVLASLEVRIGLLATGKGLLGTDDFKGAVLLSNTRGVHTMFMKYALDVAFLTDELEVLEMKTMKPWRICLPRMRAKHVLEAPVGSFERWGLKVGDRLEIRQ